MRSFVLMGLAAAGLFSACSKSPEVVTTASGLQITVTHQGDGAQPQPGEVVVAHYTGTLADGTVFDSSRDGGQPFAFTLGKNQVIKGWDEGFARLHVGDQATLVIPPALAYGDKDRPKIPANSTLHFDVELVAIKHHSLADMVGEKIDTEGLDAGRRLYAELKAGGFADAFVSEGQLNGLGYRYLMKDKNAEALAVFQWNVEQFPQSGNVYDSIGEAYVKLGDRDQALAHYRKSFELDPTNANAEHFIAALADTGRGAEAMALMQEKMALDTELNAAFENQDAGEPFDLAALGAKIEAFLAKSPDEDTGYALVRNYVYLAECWGLDEAVAAYASFADSPSAKIREFAAAKNQFAQELGHPLELSFMAIDGRAVDVAKLRGKVVLIDFWATWCGPCIAELPNVKQVYADYHERGFEIIGVSLDRAGDLQKLEDFVAREAMPWPQHYEGKKHNEGGNSIAERFAVTGIPAMLLLDKRGVIVSTNARGPKLETEVKRLLALE